VPVDDPQSGAIEVDGVDLRAIALDSWRDRVTAVFQISSASSCRCATTWRRPARPTRRFAPRSSLPRREPRRPRHGAGERLRRRHRSLRRTVQRVALARALCAVRLGAGLVLLDEPTAQLDVRGEAEIFDRILAATRHCTRF